jgi:iron complex outermembrane receptor protein
MFKKRGNGMSDDSGIGAERVVFSGILGGRLLRCLLASVGYIFLMAPAFGQVAQTTNTTSSANKSSDEITEIIVTAQKREESLSKTAIAISALTQEQLTNAGVANLTDLTSAAPNVQIEQYPFTGAIFSGIRGIVSKAWTETDDPDVPIYIDGVNIPRAFGLGSAFYDLAPAATQLPPPVAGSNSSTLMP